MEPEVLLTLVSPATSPPITRKAVRDQFRILHDCEVDLLDASIGAACHFVESESGYSVFSQAWKVSVDCRPRDRLYFPKYPVVGFSAIDYFDADNVAQSATVGDFTLFDSGMDAWLQPNEGVAWPTLFSRPDALSVTFDVGGGFDVQPTLRQAALMIAAEWYDQPTANSDKQRREIPFGASELINQNRRRWIA